MSEILTNANLRHTASRVWTCAETEFKLSWMKFCSSDNHYTTTPELDNHILIKLINEKLELFSSVLSKLFNVYIDKTSFPNNLRQAVIISVHKKMTQIMKTTIDQSKNTFLNYVKKNKPKDTCYWTYFKLSKK